MPVKKRNTCPLKTGTSVRFHRNKQNIKTLFVKLFLAKTNNSYIQFLRSIFVGAIATLADIGLLYILTDFAHTHYLVSTGIAFILGTVVNYVLSIFWVFKEKKLKSKTAEFVVFAVIGAVGLLLNELFMWLFTDVAGLYYLLSKVIATIIVFLFNFLIRKKFLF